MRNKKHEKDEPGTFVLFQNDSDNPAAPTLVGKIVLEDGTIKRLAAWEKTFMKDGVEKKLVGGKLDDYLSKEEYEKKFAGNKKRPVATQDDSQDLPF